MPGGDRPDSGQGKFYRTLFDGPQQPPAELPAQEPPAPDGDAVGGIGEPLAPFKPEMRRRLPVGMAELIVYPKQSTPESSPQFGLRVACCCTRVEDLDVEYGRANLDLDTNIAPGGLPPTKFLNAMGSWSYEKSELVHWLNLRRGAHQDQLDLVVWDDTRFRIPWELLWLPSKQESGRPAGYLGALLTVTRWVTMKPYWPENVQPYTNPASYQASGPVVAYIAPDMKHDRELLRDFAVEEATSMDDLFEILAGEPKALAMVYVAAHGEFGDDPGDCELGGFPLGRASTLNDDLPRLCKQATLVFLNGCRTGAIGFDVGRYNDGALRGFAAVFLRCGAAGVLATTGAVGTEEAGKLAGDLIRHLRENRDLPVADAVRQLRANAAEQIATLRRSKITEAERPEVDRALIPLLYPFMYIYFGSPRMVMSLAESGGLTGTGQLAGTGGWQ